jgi:hypothetical protein
LMRLRNKPLVIRSFFQASGLSLDGL